MNIPNKSYLSDHWISLEKFENEPDDLFNILMVVLAAVGFASLALSVKTLMMIAEMSGKLSGL
jgi:hypothetical protein